jgi:N-acetylneuraminic acid mutarotase
MARWFTFQGILFLGAVFVTVSGGVSSWLTITTTNTANKRWRTAPVLFQNKIYTFGGYNGDPGQIYNDVRKFDIITKTWSTVSTTGATPAKREFHAAAVH